MAGTWGGGGGKNKPIGALEVDGSGFMQLEHWWHACVQEDRQMAPIQKSVQPSLALGRLNKGGTLKTPRNIIYIYKICMCVSFFRGPSKTVIFLLVSL